MTGIPDGAFVRCHFPFGDPPEARGQPGPVPHIAYCLGARSTGEIITEYLLAYTSSGSWRGVSPVRPAGIVEFDVAQAASLNQRPFHLDLRCLARVPPSAAWFPMWHSPSRGVVAVADAVLQRRILQEAARLFQRSPEIIDTRGIGSGTVRVSRRPLGDDREGCIGKMRS